MPHKWEKDHIHLPRAKDRRVKLTDEERKEIFELYGTISQRKLAAMYGVSRRLIIFIGCPEKHARNLECRKKRGGWRQYYTTAKNTKTIKEHRQYKTKVLAQHEKDS